MKHEPTITATMRPLNKAEIKQRLVNALDEIADLRKDLIRSRAEVVDLRASLVKMQAAREAIHAASNGSVPGCPGCESAAKS